MIKILPDNPPVVPIRPLVSPTREGEQYVRPAHVQDEIRRILPMSREACMRQAKNLGNESLVFFIRLTHESDDELCGKLTKELCNRVQWLARPFCKSLDDYDKEQFLSDVEIQVLAKVFTKEPSRGREYLEIAFGQAIKGLACDELRKFRNSTAGNIAEITVDSSDEEWGGEEEVERPIEFLPGLASGPEDILLRLETAEERLQLLQKALDAVEDPRHLEAAILHWGHGIPVDSCKRGAPSLARRFRKDARQIRYWLTTAMGQMRAALGIEKSEMRPNSAA